LFDKRNKLVIIRKIITVKVLRGELVISGQYQIAKKSLLQMFENIRVRVPLRKIGRIEINGSNRKLREEL
jgi:hypothetical protein